MPQLTPSWISYFILEVLIVFVINQWGCLHSSCIVVQALTLDPPILVLGTHAKLVLILLLHI